MVVCDCIDHKSNIVLPEGFSRHHKHHRNEATMWERNPNGFMIEVFKFVGFLGYKNQYPAHAVIFVLCNDIIDIDANGCMKVSYYFGIKDQKDRVIDDDTHRCYVHRSALIPRDDLQEILRIVHYLNPRYQDCPIKFMAQLNRLIELLTAKDDYANALKICGLEFADLY
ncbi:hypothetical protein [Carp edema virus]|nr:hypothetical protein [Carp edema virus]